jgi:hypothetical protein
LEERLLGKLKTELLQPEVVDMAIESFGRQLRSSLANVSNELTEMRARKEKLEPEIRNFTHAIAENGHSKYILEDRSSGEGDFGNHRPIAFVHPRFDPESHRRSETAG